MSDVTDPAEQRRLARESAREAALAIALRANLRRRKASQQSQSAATKGAGPATDDGS